MGFRSGPAPRPRHCRAAPGRTQGLFRPPNQPRFLSFFRRATPFQAGVRRRPVVRWGRSARREGRPMKPIRKKPDDLFAPAREANLRRALPLAARMRPRTLDEFVGQEHFLGPGKLLRRLLLADRLGSLIFYGPPGSGKTALAHVIAHHTHCQLPPAQRHGLRHRRRCANSSTKPARNSKTPAGEPSSSSMSCTASTAPSRTCCCPTWKRAASSSSAPRRRTRSSPSIRPC